MNLNSSHPLFYHSLQNFSVSSGHLALMLLQIPGLNLRLEFSFNSFHFLSFPRRSDFAAEAAFFFKLYLWLLFEWSLAYLRAPYLSVCNGSLSSYYSPIPHLSCFYHHFFFLFGPLFSPDLFSPLFCDSGHDFLSDQRSNWVVKNTFETIEDVSWSTLAIPPSDT